MPKTSNQLPMALASFDHDEELFLLYTPGFEEGPQIQRDGRREPWMVDPDDPRRDIVDPLEQRKDVWFATPDIRQQMIDDVRRGLVSLKEEHDREADPERKQGLKEQITYREKFILEAPNVSTYQDEFDDLHASEYELVAMHGCGNLTMNEWYVAYLDSAFTEKHNHGPIMLALPIWRQSGPLP